MSRPAIFALVDCNNFFVSCERLFRPDLIGRPLVVLSSNDGCVISRSNEAKALGIPMGAPVFKYRDTLERHKIKQFSANFELYGDISQRITRVLTGITPRTEVYSVDESFLDLSELEVEDYHLWGRRVRHDILKKVGIPTAVGIAPTKTLAKLASEHAKRDQTLGGVLEFINTTLESRANYLLATDIKDVWGVGWRLAPRLRAEGIFNALQLSELRSSLAGQLMGVHGRQMVAELSGQPCHQLEPFGRVRQTIMKGRTFGQDTNNFEVIEAAIASLSAKAAATLRREGLLATGAMLSLNTNRHRPDYQYVRRSVGFSMPTSDTGRIINSLMQIMTEIFNPNAMYHRANVLLYDFVGEDAMQADLFGDFSLSKHLASSARSEAIDRVNKRWGGGTIRYASEDLSHSWQPKRQLRSPRYTSSWDELPEAFTS